MVLTTTVGLHTFQQISLNGISCYAFLLYERTLVVVVKTLRFGISKSEIGHTRSI